ncbi:hypothetical protein BGZ68_009303 [Mortierella alpina]|nr:hypothetical protein BGZ68_009303 [Mortierella alpina]
MICFHHNSVPPLATIITNKTPHLPNELLLDILLYVAQQHPHSLPTLYRINRHWFHLIKRYEPLLWKTATLATFPDATLPDPEDASDQSLHDPAVRWKRVYGIHLGWLTRKAQVLLVKPERPEPSSAHSASLMAAAAQHELQQQQQQQLHGHVHDHHQLALLEYQGQHSVAVADDRDHDQALSSSYSSSLVSHEPPMVMHTAVSHCTLNNKSNNNSRSQPLSVVPQQQEEDTLSCSLCTYADLCLVPQLQICVRIHRNRDQPLMQVLDWSLQHEVEMDGGVDNCHQDLISGTAVNERGTMMASCSIDGTVRVWNLNQAFCVGGDIERDHPQGSCTMTGRSFLDKVERFGCPIKSRWLLTGHNGWVNAVAIEDITIVSGGSDHTVRVWDALTGTLKYFIPDLYTSRPDLGLGVYAVAIHGSSVIGSGSVMEGYQLHDLSTGELIFELDEPLSSRDHVRFENELYQQYASRIAITDTVVVTNSKIEGMLCVWSRQTGELMYRIHVAAATGVALSGQDTGLLCGSRGQKESSRTCEQERGGRLVTYEASRSSTRIRREGAAAAADVGVHEDEETVHTFKINKSGSMLMCTLCDGRASLIEFGSGSMTRGIPCSTWVVEASGHGSLMPQAEQQNVGYQQHQEHYHHCGALAWAWTRTSEGQNRVVLV